MIAPSVGLLEHGVVALAPHGMRHNGGAAIHGRELGGVGDECGQVGDASRGPALEFSQIILTVTSTRHLG